MFRAGGGGSFLSLGNYNFFVFYNKFRPRLRSRWAIGVDSAVERGDSLIQRIMVNIGCWAESGSV